MFLAEEIAKALSNAKAIAILDKADSLNAAGGALFEDTVSGLYTSKIQIPAISYVYGIGGRDVRVEDIETVYKDLEEIAKTGEVNYPYRHLGVRGC